VYYIATSRELKRLDSLALSPIFGNFNESLQGLLTLRAFRKQDQFTTRNHALLDKSNRCWWPIQVVNRCFSHTLYANSQLQSDIGVSDVLLRAYMLAFLTDVPVNLKCDVYAKQCLHAVM